MASLKADFWYGVNPFYHHGSVYSTSVSGLLILLVLNNSWCDTVIRRGRIHHYFTEEVNMSFINLCF
jgi:hypothetical protein